MTDKNYNDNEEFVGKINPFLQTLYQKLIETLKSSEDIPQGQEYEYLTSYKYFGEETKGLGNRILRMTQRLIESESVGISNPDINLSELSKEEVEESFEEITNITDSLLEKVV